MRSITPFLFLFLFSCGQDDSKPLVFDFDTGSSDDVSIVNDTNDETSDSNDLGSDIETLTIRHRDAIKSAIERFAAENTIPGMSVVVYDQGESEVFTYGVQTLGTSNEVTPDTRFNLASVSKIFTGLTIMSLHDSGHLAINGPASAIAPNLEYLSPTLTVKNILEHSSGLGFPEYLLTNELPAGFAALSDSGKRKAMFNFTAWESWAEPGLVWNYNNQGYSLLAYLAETAAESPFETLIAERIFAPLNINTAGYYGTDNFPNGGPLVSAHTNAQASPPFAWSPVAIGHGGIWMSGTDMQNFMTAVVEEDSSLPKQFKERVMGNNGIGVSSFGDSHRYNYGWERLNLSDIELIGHAGGYPGVSTDLLIAPNEEMGVAIFANTTDLRTPIRTLTIDLLEILEDLKFEQTSVAFDVDLSENLLFTSKSWGPFALGEQGEQRLLYFQNWDYSTEFRAFGARSGAFQITNQIATEVFGDSGAGTTHYATIYEGENGEMYFVGRTGIGVPIPN